tara:strand:- start:347 stop:838 length:492 start_codon:yes stop_codon:yes gene_type:complete
MADEINPEPLPENFYNRDGWLKNIMNFYAVEKKLLPEDVLKRAVEGIVNALYNVITINRNWPQDTHNLFKQAVGPLWDPKEYREKIYNSFKTRAKTEDEPRLDIIAESLIYIRYLFEQDKTFLEEIFSEEIQKLDGDVDRLALALQTIVKTHTNQVIKMLAKR